MAMGWIWRAESVIWQTSMLSSFDIKPYDKEGYVFIAGTPRCGTQYIAHALQAIDVDVQHEAFGTQGITAFCIVPYLANRKEGIVIHQTREPLKVIASMHTIKPNTWDYIINQTGIDPAYGGILHAVMRLYLKLNNHIDKYHHFRYKIEDIGEKWAQLLDIIGIPNQPLPDIPTNTHTRKDKYLPLTWAELEFRDAELTKYICEMGHSYGY